MKPSSPAWRAQSSSRPPRGPRAANRLVSICSPAPLNATLSSANVRVGLIATSDAMTKRSGGRVEALYEMGSAHDFGWHLQNRGRRDGQWVDLAMIVAWGGLIAWVLLHH
jgi:hypothetical protein